MAERSSTSNWDRYRRKHLRRYEEAKQRGLVDEDVIPLLDLVNSSPDYVTTSSCSGRVVLLETTPDEKKKESAFYFKKHSPVSAGELLCALHAYTGDHVLWLKFDPFILHVAARDVPHATRLVAAARRVGIKISGIQHVRKTRAHVEVRGIDTLALPVYDGGVLVDDGYIEYVVGVVNRKFARNERRRTLLHNELKALIGGK